MIERTTRAGILCAEGLLCDPKDGSRLEFHPLGDEGDGVLVSGTRGRAWPVRGNVPIMLPEAFWADFLRRHGDEIARNERLSALPALSGGAARASGADEDWSFSREWDAHFEAETERTWGYTVQERIEQLFMETGLSPDDLAGMRVLDAGCGNGMLTDALGPLCGMVVGLDYSSGVMQAERRRKADNVHFIRADLMAPPLAPQSFDLVFSIGVLHHTPDTRRAFDATARLVRPGGRFYFWLYRRPERFFGRMLKVPLYDAMRLVISRLPPFAQDALVKAYARAVRLSHRLRGRGRQIPLREYVVAAYDDLTCRWRHYHHPIEVARWLHEAGFAAPTLSHWDNPFGFGVVAERLPEEAARAEVPGVRYGSGPKLWDSSESLLGRLHSD